jgi:hypothetical protein
MAQQNATDDASEELADEFDGATVTCEDMSGVWEYSVTVQPQTIAELPERTGPGEFAENIAKSRFEKEYPNASGLGVSTMSDEDRTYYKTGHRFTVWVRYD